MGELTTEEIFDKYCENKKHAEEVKRISLLIFDEVNKKIKELSPLKRQLLESSALLHDIGYAIDSKSHHKHSQKLILEKGLSEFTLRQTMMISCMCRYHKGGLPDKKDHEIYSSLDKKERKTVKRLGGILKIADGLESKQIGQIKNITLEYDEDNNITEIYLHTKTNDYRPDIMPAVRKKDLFEIGFKTQVVYKYAEI